MFKDILFGQIRHYLTIAAGALVTHGLTDSSGAEQLTGALMALAGVGWSIADKYLQNRLQNSIKPALPTNSGSSGNHQN